MARAKRQTVSPGAAPLGNAAYYECVKALAELRARLPHIERNYGYLAVADDIPRDRQIEIESLLAEVSGDREALEEAETERDDAVREADELRDRITKARYVIENECGDDMSALIKCTLEALEGE